MGVYDDEFAADAAEVLGEVGRSATYSPGGSSPVTITMKVGPEAVEELDEQDGRVRVRRRVALALPSVVASPSTTDKVTIGTVVYGVKHVELSGLFQRFELESREVVKGGGRRSRIERQ